MEELHTTAQRICSEPLRPRPHCLGPKTILITGANSGIGLAAARVHLLIALSSAGPSPPHHQQHQSSIRLLLVCRTLQKAQIACREALAVIPAHHRAGYAPFVIPYACDQASYASVRALADCLHSQPFLIDVLCLNAAVLQPQYVSPTVTEDGNETTLQTNYLSPFLLVHLLQSRVTERIVLTSSGLHEKVEVDDLHPYPNGDSVLANYHHKRAYAQSKVYLVSLCASLAEQQNKGVTVTCFSPGLVPGTGLFRDNPELIGVHPPPVPNRSVAWGGGALVYMALAQATAAASATYWSTNVRSDPATDYGQHFTAVSIRDRVTPQVRQAVWNMSKARTGIVEVVAPIIPSKADDDGEDESFNNANLAVTISG